MKLTKKMQKFLFIDLFKSAVHVSGDVLAHPQNQFNCIYSFGAMHRTVADRSATSENIARNM
jgi:hypothetical protein